jgi:hypothetical protein
MSAIMKRSAGVTTIAIVSLLGSALALCMGVLTGVMAFLIPRSTSPAPPAAALAVAGAFYFLPGVWGLLSGIGLIRLKNWARISAIVFGVLLLLAGAFTAVMTAIMWKAGLPAGDQIDPVRAASVLAIVRGMMAALALGEIGIGAWFVVFLTRPKVAAQFKGGTTATAGTASGRPISITIIAWFMLVGVLGVILPLVVHVPVPLFLTTLEGLPATAYLIAMAGVAAYSGVGLLRLQPMARLAAIGYFVFGILNTTVFTLAPGWHERLAVLVERQQAMTAAFVPASPTPPLFDPVNVIYASLGASALLMLVPLYFLVTNKRAFEPSPNR